MPAINQEFDAGNIEVIDASDASNIRLQIRKDAHSDFYQWFYFSVAGVKNQALTLRIENAAGAAYPGGFEGYRICYSYDRRSWRRHDTVLIDGRLEVEFTSDYDQVYFAYFAPFSMERHFSLIAAAQLSSRAQLQRLGDTLDGQALDLIHLPSTSAKPKTCWIIARQHPGETMAEWWMEGALDCLLDSQDKLANSLLSRCEFYLVPNMNPDGSRRGHLRTNAAGRNLNREWIEPSLEASPEVFLVKQRIIENGCDFFLDVHGDETLPYCFIAGTEGLHDWNEEQQHRLDFYKQRLAELSEDFQTEVGYGAKAPGQANYSMSTAQVASLTGCLAMTLEMPFKDTTATPEPEFGWSPKRSAALARQCLAALHDYVDEGYC